MRLKNETALVTGASRGIGKGIAAALGREGAQVIGTATTETGQKTIIDFFAEEGIKGRAYQLNVAVPDSVKALGESLKGAELAPSILINNAGITRDNLMLRMKDEEWEEVINTNLNSVFRLSKLCLRQMAKARHGRIINITSVVACAGNPGQSNYAAAKAGMIGFTRSLAREFGARGITVNAIAPGFIETDMTEALSEDQRQALLADIALNRLGHVDDIANAVVFLCSPGANYITGQTLHVNGGMYMG